MTYPSSTTLSAPAGIDLRENALAILFVLLTVAVLAFRLLVTPDLMNQFMSYTNEGGPFYEKIHLATYAAMILLLALLLCRMSSPPALAGRDIDFLRSMLRYAVLIGVFIGYFALGRQFSAIGFVIETYLAAVLSVVIVLLQGAQARRLVATAMLCLLIASAFVAIIEAVLQRNLMSFQGGWDLFRAYGLANHPLVLGAQCVLAIGFVPLTRWPRWVKIAAILILLVGCVAANARTALAACLVETVLLILFSRWGNLSRRRELQAKFATLLAALVLGVVLTGLFLSMGLLSRFTSVVDDSSLARIQIYAVFDYVTWKDIFFGMRAADLMQIVNEKVGLQYIESVPVFFIMLMGLPIAILFTLVIIGYLLRLLGGAVAAARISAILMILVDLSNNAFATKSVNLLLLAVLVVGLGKISDAGTPGRVIPRTGRSLQPARRG